ncbi:MAG: hypothetical protein ACR2O0_15870 [Rhizobiaceae bacterium]
MKKMTSIIAAGAILAVSAGSAIACPYSSTKYESAADQNMTVVEAPADTAQSEAVSTFDPKILQPEEKTE